MRLIVLICCIVAGHIIKAQTNFDSECKTEFRDTFFKNLKIIESYFKSNKKRRKRCYAKYENALIFFDRHCGIEQWRLTDGHNPNDIEYFFYAKWSFDEDKIRWVNWLNENCKYPLNIDSCFDNSDDLIYKLKDIDQISSLLGVYIFEAEHKYDKFLIEILRKDSVSNRYLRKRFFLYSDGRVDSIEAKWDSIVVNGSSIISSSYGVIADFNSEKFKTIEGTNIGNYIGPHSLARELLILNNNKYYEYERAYPHKLGIPLNLHTYIFNGKWIGYYSFYYDDNYILLKKVDTLNEAYEIAKGKLDKR